MCYCLSYPPGLAGEPVVHLRRALEENPARLELRVYSLLLSPSSFCAECGRGVDEFLRGELQARVGHAWSIARRLTSKPSAALPAEQYYATGAHCHTALENV